MHTLQENSTSGSKSYHPEVFYKKDALKNFTKFTGKHLCRNHFFSKVAGLRPATLLKKRFGHMCFPVNFVNFLRSPFYRTHSSGCVELYQKALVEFSCEKYVNYFRKKYSIIDVWDNLKYASAMVSLTRKGREEGNPKIHEYSHFDIRFLILLKFMSKKRPSVNFASKIRRILAN